LKKRSTDVYCKTACEIKASIIIELLLSALVRNEINFFNKANLKCLRYRLIKHYCVSIMAMLLELLTEKHLKKRSTDVYCKTACEIKASIIIELLLS
jgi:hypothetical protein